MKVSYISSSLIPSSSANSIHVLRMCEAISQLGHVLDLFFIRTCKKRDILQEVESSYGIQFNRVVFRSIFFPFSRGGLLILGVYAALSILLKIGKQVPDLIISRNLYASFLLALTRKFTMMYEIHAPEKGFKGKIQKYLIFHQKIKIVVISQKLKDVLIAKYNLPLDLQSQIFVFHDAAPEGEIPYSDQEKEEVKKQLIHTYKIKGDFFVGYFGSLYSGRGIDIIIQLAKKNREMNFLVFGGNQKQIQKFQKQEISANVYLMGHVPYSEVFPYMKAMDILLMPYQNEVSIGVAGIETSKWMSPIKMFEYMSSGVPMIASDLPVLREVLEDQRNSLLAKPDSVESWQEKLILLSEDKDLYRRISLAAYRDYQEQHSWKRRVANMVLLFEGDEEDD